MTDLPPVEYDSTLAGALHWTFWPAPALHLTVLAVQCATRSGTSIRLFILDVPVSVERMPQPTPHCLSASANTQALTTADDGLIGHDTPSLKRSGDPDRHDGLARFFHWIFAVAIIYTSIAGYTLAQLSDGPVREFLSRLNMSIATVLILLFPLRVIWKFVRTEPRALAHVSATQSRLAHGAHALIYMTIFAVLTSGFLMVPDGYSFFGLVEIHTPFAKGALTDQLFIIHRASCALLAALVVLHVLAVVKHQLINRVDVLRRML